MSPANQDRVQELREQLADWDRQIAVAQQQRAVVAAQLRAVLRHG